MPKSKNEAPVVVASKADFSYRPDTNARVEYITGQALAEFSRTVPGFWKPDDVAKQADQLTNAFNVYGSYVELHPMGGKVKDSQRRGRRQEHPRAFIFHRLANAFERIYFLPYSTTVDPISYRCSTSAVPFAWTMRIFEAAANAEGASQSVRLLYAWAIAHPEACAARMKEARGLVSYTDRENNFFRPPGARRGAKKVSD